MNFKIENNFLDITNYPSMEKHFEKMAKEGWLISKIFTGNLFIYKKIEGEELDFSITPYEVETEFTKKSKEELEEFKSVCESVGWNYATKSYDLHIYFKEKGSEATPIQTDEEEEFKTLEFIAKKRIRTYYFQLPFLIIISWFLLGGINNNVYFMKDGLAQIVAPLLLLGLLLNVWALVHFKSFLKKNRKNMEVGEGIEYSNSKFYIPKLAFPITFVFLVVILIYVLYMGIILKNKTMLIAFVPSFIGIALGLLYRIIVKPSKKSKKVKKLGLLALVLGATIIAIWIGMISLGNLTQVENNETYIIENYKVISIADFPGETLSWEGSLMKQRSFLVPESYKYSSSTKEGRGLITEYGRALTENLARKLVDRYIDQSENALTGRYGREVTLYLKEGVFDDYLLNAGITEADLTEQKNKDIKKAEKEARKIIQERSIINANEEWNLDEAFFLNFKKTQLLLRNGKEVYFLEGEDFSENELIKIIKKKLQLH